MSLPALQNEGGKQGKWKPAVLSQVGRHTNQGKSKVQPKEGGCAKKRGNSRCCSDGFGVQSPLFFPPVPSLSCEGKENGFKSSKTIFCWRSAPQSLGFMAARQTLFFIHKGRTKDRVVIHRKDQWDAGMGPKLS